MKRPLLLSLLALSLPMHADDTYLLPHRWQDARHALTSAIRSAPSRIIIVTDSIDDRIVRRTLQDAVKAHKQITLITSSQRTAGAWAMYRTVDACILDAAEPLGFSLLVTDSPRSCSATLPLETEALRNRYGMVQCDFTNDFNETIASLKKECRAYLEP